MILRHLIRIVHSFSEIAYFHFATATSGPGSHHYRSFTIILRHTTLVKTPLDELSAQRRHLYLTKHKKDTSIFRAGFKPVIPGSERPQTQALDCAATGIGGYSLYLTKIH